MQNHFDKYCFAGKKQVRFRFGIGSDDGVGQMKSYKQQQDSRIIKENTLHIVYMRIEPFVSLIGIAWKLEKRLFQIPTYKTLSDHFLKKTTQ
jgi:hypothetical protein